jgi:hypothetical protein
MNWDPLCEREGGRSVTESVKRPGRDAGGLAVLPEPCGEPLRVDRPADPVGEHEVAVAVGRTGEVAFEQLRLTMPGEDANRLGIIVRRDRADFGGPIVQPPLVGT